MTFTLQIDTIKQKVRKGINMKKILCFGDSNTWGHNPVDCSQLERRWTVILQEMLPDCEIIQDGRCGRATKFDVPDMPDTNGLKTFRERYLQGEKEFDLIIIMLGTNDLLNHFDCSAEETASTLRTYVKECHEKFGKDKPQILLVSPILVRDYVTQNLIFKDQYDMSAVIKSKSFAQNISAVAQQEGVHFLDASKAAMASSVDGVHMDYAEHEKLAIAIAAKIKSILF